LLTKLLQPNERVHHIGLHLLEAIRQEHLWKGYNLRKEVSMPSALRGCNHLHSNTLTERKHLNVEGYAWSVLREFMALLKPRKELKNRTANARDTTRLLLLSKTIRGLSLSSTQCKHQQLHSLSSYQPTLLSRRRQSHILPYFTALQVSKLPQDLQTHAHSPSLVMLGHRFRPVWQLEGLARKPIVCLSAIPLHQMTDLMSSLLAKQMHTDTRHSCTHRLQSPGL
jgi:hypothetical protein